MLMERLVELKGITVSFARKKNVLENLDFTFERGKIYGLIGNNGVGKTTLLKVITGMISPVSGTVEFGERKPNVGVLIEKPGLYRDMNAFQNLKAKCICLGLKKSKEEIKALIELVGLQNAEKKRVRAYSMGMKQRLGIAMALLGAPDFLVLDEPLNGLDPQGIADMRNLFAKIHEEREITMLISSHILDELVKTVTDICVMNHGNIIKSCTTEQFVEESGGMNLDEFYMKLIAGS